MNPSAKPNSSLNKRIEPLADSHNAYATLNTDNRCLSLPLLPQLLKLVKTVMAGSLLLGSGHALALSTSELNQLTEAPPLPKVSAANSDLVNYGAYVARAGDCMACHGKDYSGGLPMSLPMGEIIATNITPSVESRYWQLYGKRPENCVTSRPHADPYALSCYALSVLS